MEMAVKTAERGRAAAPAVRRTPFPAAGKLGERRPLASLLHGFLGALPRGENVAFGG